MNWKKWLYGLFAAVLGGFATGALVVLTDPASFDWSHWQRPLTVGGAAALISFLAYIKNPPPNPWNGTDRRNNGG